MAPQRTDSREIERKFLLRRPPPEGLTSYAHALIEQGYLALEDGGGQVRLRRAGDVYSLTYKRGTKTTREEREVRLTAEQFEALWPATAERRLSKIRYDVPWQTWTIEIDVYAGRHEGLVVAEVEFDDDDACRNFIPPDWLGDDVSGDPRYSNVVLALQ